MTLFVCIPACMAKVICQGDLEQAKGVTVVIAVTAINNLDNQIVQL
jgi:hypothetical protein